MASLNPSPEPGGQQGPTSIQRADEEAQIRTVAQCSGPTVRPQHPSWARKPAQSGRWGLRQNPREKQKEPTLGVGSCTRALRHSSCKRASGRRPGPARAEGSGSCLPGKGSRARWPRRARGQERTAWLQGESVRAVLAGPSLEHTRKQHRR